MTATYGIEQRKTRWCDFLDMSKPPSHMFLISYNPDPPERPSPWPTKVQERIDWAWSQYARQMEQLAWLRHDTIPFLEPYTGTEIFAEAFGCPVQRFEDTMPFARPLIHSAREVASLRVPDIGAPPLATLFAIADELRRRAGPGAMMKLVDIQSPMDIAALIWDKNEFYIGIHESPEAVKELAAKVSALLTNFMDEWFRRYGTDFIAHFPSYYMPKGITLSEDEVGSVNREMFERFFLPELEALSNRYGGLGMHCCAHARHQWASFAKIPNLRLLNLVQPNDTLRAAWAFFADKVPQMHSWFGDGPAWTWPAQYPAGARMVMRTEATTVAEAQETADKLWAACGRDV
jgi:hypothetical protein